MGRRIRGDHDWYEGKRTPHNKGVLKYGEASFTIHDPRIEPVPESGCWLWVGYVASGTGYGQTNRPLWYPGKTANALAHRVVWTQAKGSIPDGMVLDHICRVRSCVNPDHLRVVTTRENVLYNSHSIPALSIARGHCKCGAEYKRSKRQRYCQACNTRYAKQRREREQANQK